MKKMKTIIKNNLFGFIIGALIFGVGGVYAATYYASSDVSYDNTVSGMSSNNVQDAIDELYEVTDKIPKISASIEKGPKTVEIKFPSGCDSNYTCTYGLNSNSGTSVTKENVTLTYSSEGEYTLYAKVTDGNFTFQNKLDFTVEKLNSYWKYFYVSVGDQIYYTRSCSTYENSCEISAPNPKSSDIPSYKEFKGWRGDNGAEFQPGETIVIGSGDDYGTFDAILVSKQYYATFYSNGKWYTSRMCTCLPDCYIYKPADPSGEYVPAGKQFVGWNTSQFATTGLSMPLKITKNTTLYAIFK